VGVLEVEEVAVQVCQRGVAAAGREWLDHLELAQSEVTGERSEVCGAVWREPEVAQPGGRFDLLPVGHVRTR
jgi:hypothetical protein